MPKINIPGRNTTVFLTPQVADERAPDVKFAETRKPDHETHVNSTVIDLTLDGGDDDSDIRHNSDGVPAPKQRTPKGKELSSCSTPGDNAKGEGLRVMDLNRNDASLGLASVIDPNQTDDYNIYAAAQSRGPELNAAANTYLKTYLCPHIRLKRHQSRAVAWMLRRERVVNQGGILADEPGLGKTLSFLSFIVLSEQGRAHQPEDSPSCRHNTLIIAPNKAVQQQWMQQAAKCFQAGFKIWCYDGLPEYGTAVEAMPLVQKLQQQALTVTTV